MKETYSRPTITNADIESKVEAIPAIVGLALGYAAGRAITKAVEARPMIKLPALTRAKL